MNCDEAFQDLLQVLEPNLELQKAYLLENLWEFKNEVNHPFSDYSEFFDEDDVDQLIFAVSKANSLDEIPHSEIPATFLPPYFLFKDVEVLNNVPFVHTMPYARAESIRKSTLYGRATPKKLVLTRSIEDFYIAGNGYIFAYELSEFSNHESLAVKFSSHIKGYTEKALKFFFVPDEEYQLIVPIKCIESYTIEDEVTTSKQREREDMLAWHLNLPDPLKKTLK